MPRKENRNMAEYIEREALIAEYDRVHVGAPGGERKLMVEAPAVDVVSREELIDAFEEYISEMTVSKWGTKFECETARSAVRMAVMFVLGERKEQT